VARQELGSVVVLLGAKEDFHRGQPPDTNLNCALMHGMRTREIMNVAQLDEAPRFQALPKVARHSVLKEPRCLREVEENSRGPV